MSQHHHGFLAIAFPRYFGLGPFFLLILPLRPTLFLNKRVTTMHVTVDVVRSVYVLPPDETFFVPGDHDSPVHSFIFMLNTVLHPTCYEQNNISLDGCMDGWPNSLYQVYFTFFFNYFYFFN